MRLTIAMLLSIVLSAPVWATEAPVRPYKAPSYNASTSDGPADNLNRFMLKITDQCYAMSDTAQRAECCKHLIENVCSSDAMGKK